MWEYFVTRSKRIAIVRSSGDDGRYICETSKRVSGDEFIIQARLIAAAPDLLAACEAALDEDSGLMCADQLRAAIAKAKREE